MSTALKVENLAKRYRLGEINRRMLYQDVQSWWARLRGREDPNAPIGADGRHARTGDFWALRDINFEVREGESVGIIGRNGAGKSTLLKILSEITLPTEGKVFLRGRVASLLEVGTGFHQELTGRENVFLNGAILGMTQAEVRAKFDEIASFSGVEEFLDTPVKRYSSGMRVRLAFAVAAYLEPEILIIDEVLAVGDAAFQQKCLGKLDAVAQQGRTVIFVSHNMVAIENLCQRGIVLDEGRLVFDGSQVEAVNNYLERQSTVSTDLATRTDRRGNGAVLLTAVQIRDNRGHTVETLCAGTDAEIAIRFQRRSKQTWPDASVYISVRSQLEVPVFHQNNQFHQVRFGPLPEEGEFVCRLRDLPLPAGRYHLNIGVKSNLQGGDLLDHLDAAAEFSVSGGDFFGSGFDVPGQLGVCYVRAEWRLEDSVPTASATCPG